MIRKLNKYYIFTADKILKHLMKYKFILFFLCTFSSLATSQIINIPDADFKDRLVSTTVLSQNAKDLNGNYTKIDLNNDGEIQINEAENLSYLSVSSSGIKSLAGIEKFINLTFLNCGANSLTNLDLSGNTKLITLEASANYVLKTVNVSNNILLEKLNLAANNLQEIDVTKNSNLLDFSCFGNFTDLNLSLNSKLKKLYLTGDSLINLNLNGCIALTDADIRSNSIINLAITNAPNINTLSIKSNSLTNLNLSGIQFLNSLTLENLPSSSLDLSGNIELKSLTIYGTHLTSIDLSKNTNLNFLYLIGTSSLKDIDFSTVTALKTLMISNNNSIQKIDVTKNINLDLLNVFNCSALTSIFVKNGKKQNFGENFLNCPNLKNICCDESEVPLFTNPNYLVVTDCSSLSTGEQQSLVSSKNLFAPNPATERIFFKEKFKTISIIDSSGKLMKKLNLNSSELSVSDLPKGVYILKLETEKGFQKAKLIKN